MRVWALVVAAGNGSRFAAERAETAMLTSANTVDLPKQYHPLLQKPMLAHTLTALMAVPTLERVDVVLHPDDLHFDTLIPPYLLPLAKPLPQAFRCGGATRAESVRNGLLALNQVVGNLADDWVLVHDAARPCVDPLVVTQMIFALTQHPDQRCLGGILACPLADTLKRGAPMPVHAPTTEILATPSRTDLWLAQTPQLFRATALMQALTLSWQQGLLTQMTDEAMVVQWWSQALAEQDPKLPPSLPPLLFRGPRDNIKVTYAEDLRLAEAILQAHQTPTPLNPR